MIMAKKWAYSWVSLQTSLTRQEWRFFYSDLKKKHRKQPTIVVDLMHQWRSGFFYDKQQLIHYTLIPWFPNESAPVLRLLALKICNPKKTWLFRKWWNFHIPEYFQNLILPPNHTFGYLLQYPSPWFTMVLLWMGVNFEIQKRVQKVQPAFWCSWTLKHTLVHVCKC